MNAVREQRRRQGAALFPVLLALLALMLLRRLPWISDILQSIPLIGPSLPLFALAIGTLIWRLRAGDRWRDFGIRRPRHWWTIPVYGGAAALLSLLLPVVLTPLLISAGLAAPELPTAPDLPAGIGGLIVLLLVMWLVNAFGEELLHRGFIMTRLAWLWGDDAGAWRRALIVSSVFFGLGHTAQGTAGILLTAMAALIYGLSYWLSGNNLWPAVVAHGIKNSVSLTLIFLAAG